MKKYDVTVACSRFYGLIIEAESEEDARTKVQEEGWGSGDIDPSCDPEDGEIDTVVEIEEHNDDS